MLACMLHADLGRGGLSVYTWGALIYREPPLHIKGALCIKRGALCIYRGALLYKGGALCVYRGLSDI